MATFLQLRDRAALRYGDPHKLTILDVVWKDYINSRYRRVQAESPLWPFLRGRQTMSFTAGSRSVALTTNVFRVTAVYNVTDDVILAPMDGHTQYRREYPTDIESGVPQVYRVRGGSLDVFPLPTQTTSIMVDYFVSAVDLAADGDVPVFPAAYHDMLISGALADVYTDDGTRQGETHQADYERQLSNMKLDLLDTPHERYVEIVDNWYG